MTHSLIVGFQQEANPKLKPSLSINIIKVMIKVKNKTLLQYILSFRNQHAFDNICIAINSLDDLYAYPL